MLKLLLLLLFPVVGSAQSFQYDLNITPEKYELGIHMKFRDSTALAEVVRGFKNGQLLAEISDSIESVTLEPSISDNSVLKMHVRSFGISSILISKCKEEYEIHRWRRECELQTDIEDGGTYMNWKKDTIECKAEVDGVRCDSDIQGSSKAISILGITLATSQAFSLRAKVQALYNFAQVWWAIDQSTLNFDEIQDHFKASSLKEGFDKMQDEGLSALKAQPAYQFSLK